MELVEGKTKIISYSDLSKYSSIEEALDPHGSLIILYETKENFGHWVSLFVVDDCTLEFFDPYAYAIDDELAMVPEYFREESGQDYPHLTQLIKNSAKFSRVIYNQEKLQKLKKDVNTCGRWAGIRTQMRAVPLKVFQKLFLKQKFDPDWYVCALTGFVR